MFKKVVALALVCLMMMTMFAACGKSKLVGTWEVEEDGVSSTMTFNKDGTGEMEVMGMKVELEWEAKKGELTITTEVMGQKSEATSEYKIKGKTLIMTNEGESVEWTKVKK